MQVQRVQNNSNLNSIYNNNVNPNFSGNISKAFVDAINKGTNRELMSYKQYMDESHKIVDENKLIEISYMATIAKELLRKYTSKLNKDTVLDLYDGTVMFRNKISPETSVKFSDAGFNEWCDKKDFEKTYKPRTVNNSNIVYDYVCDGFSLNEKIKDPDFIEFVENMPRVAKFLETYISPKDIDAEFKNAAIKKLKAKRSQVSTSKDVEEVRELENKINQFDLNIDNPYMDSEQLKFALDGYKKAHSSFNIDSPYEFDKDVIISNEEVVKLTEQISGLEKTIQISSTNEQLEKIIELKRQLKTKKQEIQAQVEVENKKILDKYLIPEEQYKEQVVETKEPEKDVPKRWWNFFLRLVKG